MIRWIGYHRFAGHSSCSRFLRLPAEHASPWDMQAQIMHSDIRARHGNLGHLVRS